MFEDAIPPEHAAACVAKFSIGFVPIAEALDQKCDIVGQLSRDTKTETAIQRSDKTCDTNTDSFPCGGSNVANNRARR
jgi:hypothetical protein